ncbi:MAG TPA: Ig-like domain-containing protein [Gemmatimonadaceae bacterium]
MTSPRNIRLGLVALVLSAGCASAGMPPGGPADKTPPVLLKVTPESGSLHVGPRQVVTFRFDEVVNERVRAGGGLDQGVVVSPTDGPVSVDWHRSSITIRSRKVWRPDLAYTVTILSGLQDLSGNATKKPVQTVFSTGSVIPHGEVRGVAFDWVAQQAKGGARVEAMIGNDTTLKFIAVADTAGRFVMTTLPAGTLHVRVYDDANSNRVLDPREQWDSATVTLADTASREFYMFAHDTLGPSLLDVTPVDSVTLRVKFDRPLRPGAPLEASQFSLKMKDSTKIDSVLIEVLRVSSAARFDTVTQQRKTFVADSTMRADTSVAGRREVQRKDSLARAARQDSIAQAQIASVKALRDTTPKILRPKPSRAAPVSEFILELARPLQYDVFATLSVRDAMGLTGHTHRPARVKQVVLRKPAPKDSTAAKAAKPPAKDSTAAKTAKPPATDSTARKAAKPAPVDSTALKTKKP